MEGGFTQTILVPADMPMKGNNLNLMVYSLTWMASNGKDISIFHITIVGSFVLSSQCCHVLQFSELILLYIPIWSLKCIHFLQHVTLFLTVNCDKFYIQILKCL